MKLAIFDCDGTLVDSQNLIVSAMNSAFADVDRAPLPRDRVLSIVGLSLPLAIEHLLPDAPPTEIAAITAGYKSAFAELRADPAAHEPLYEGILDLLGWLHGHDETLLAIATGKSRRGVDRILQRFDLEGRFVAISTADEHPSKPHPSMIEHAMTTSGVAAEHTVMIGDTTFDVAMARAAGVAAIAVDWGYHPTEQLSGAGADVIVGSADELSRELAQRWQMPERVS
ncbi:MAG: HAD-IA family hydrolase [Pseudomonadota bacterium]